MSTATSRSKYTIKLVIIGPTGVGKTSLRGQYIAGRFSAAYRATIGADFIAKTLPHPSKPGQNVILQIWDTAGQERFSNLSKAFYRGADAVIMVFDAHQPESLNALNKSWAEFREGAPLAEENLLEYPCFVVGNKVDLTGDVINEETTVSRKQAQEFVAGLMSTFTPSAVPTDSAGASSNAINIDTHLSPDYGLGVARFSRNSLSSPTSRPGTISSINTTMSIYHTPSSSLFPEIYHTARSSLRSWSTDTSQDNTPIIKQRRITHLPNESTSGESAVTITPGLFARERSAEEGSQETALTTPEDGILEPNPPSLVPTPPERGPSLHLTSAKTGQGVRELFEHVAARVMLKVEYDEYMEARQMHYREASGTETIRLGPERRSLSDLKMSACCS